MSDVIAVVDDGLFHAEFVASGVTPDADPAEVVCAALLAEENDIQVVAAVDDGALYLNIGNAGEHRLYLTVRLDPATVRYRMIRRVVGNTTPEVE